MSADLIDIFKFLPEGENSSTLSENLIRRLVSGEPVMNHEFDRIFPARHRISSSVHWSPIEVARQVARWIAPLETGKFIDIGCGVGKMCILMSLFSHHKIYGVEQRKKLVSVANDVIARNGLGRTSITNGNMMEMNWSDFDIFYLYNPFQEHVTDVPVGYTSEVFRQLTWMPPGKILITFHGYGGGIPKNWLLTFQELVAGGELKMWVKTR